MLAENMSYEDLTTGATDAVRAVFLRGDRRKGSEGVCAAGEQMLT